MTTIDEIRIAVNATLEEVRAQTTKVDGLNTLLDGMRQQIADLIANSGQVPQDVADNILAVLDATKAVSAKLDETLTENVPPTP